VATPRGDINLRLRPLSQLRQHEETVQRLSEALLRKLVRDGVQRDPVVVDEATGTILDGAHRVEALGKAGANYALTYLVDYADPRVRLYRWYRVVTRPGTAEAREIIDELNLKRLGHIGTRDLSPRPRSSLVVAYLGEAYGRKTTDIEVDVRTMREFDRAAGERRLRVGFIDEASGTPRLLRGDDLVLIPPGLGKEDVLRAGAEGKLLPPKSTLHVFPLRPLGVDYPLEDLRAGRDILDRLLESRGSRVIEPRSTHRGRGYRERVVVFE